jgi:hypothetical protein
MVGAAEQKRFVYELTASACQSGVLYSVENPPPEVA